MNNELLKNELVNFLENHKRNPENLNSEGYYDPNPFWLADDILTVISKFKNNEKNKM